VHPNPAKRYDTLVGISCSTFVTPFFFVCLGCFYANYLNTSSTPLIERTLYCSGKPDHRASPSP